MRRRGPSFGAAFREDLPIALGMSVMGAVFWQTYFRDSSILLRVALILASILWSAVSFAAVLAAAQSWILPRLKFPSFLAAVLTTSLTYLAVIMIGIPAGVGGTAAIATHGPRSFENARAAVRFVLNPWLLLIAFCLMVAITLFFMVRKKLGPGVLENWMLGRYYRPREEDRIFMFLDMKDSTTLAEQMGNLKFSRLIQKFFEDITEPVLASRGEVSHYIGDEAVLTWKRARGLANCNVLRCFFGIRQAIEANADGYRQEFGFVPGFKAGVHLGSVVATQVGEIKSEIVYHGDVLNTTARIQGLCNEIGTDFLISQELCDALGGAAGYSLSAVGAHELKGKEAAVELVKVEAGS